MSYAHIENLYRKKDILLFKQVFCLEKIHGTSSSVTYNIGDVTFFAGGEKHENFIKLFDKEKLLAKFKEEFGDIKVKVYGEAYGGKCQGMSHKYGKDLKFVAFEVEVDGMFLNVPTAHRVVEKLGLEFVDYVLIDCTIENLDKERLKPSIQAIRNGCGDNHKREGIVIRPPIEVRMNNGERVMAKYKNDDFEERKNTPKVLDASQQQIMEDAEAIADEWVTAQRLDHVLDKIFLNGEPLSMDKTGEVLKAMIEDVMREASGEIVDNKAVRSAISKKAVGLWKAKFKIQ